MRRGWALVALLLVVACSPSAPTTTPQTPSPTVPLSARPYPRGDYQVPNPRLSYGVALCDLLSEQEKAALLGPEPRSESGGTDCTASGPRGYVNILSSPWSVDVDSEQDTSDRPGYRDTISGNSTWISPNSGGCSIMVAINRHAAEAALELGGSGTYTCDQLRSTVQLIIDRLEPDLRKFNN